MSVPHSPQWQQVALTDAPAFKCIYIRHNVHGVNATVVARLLEHHTRYSKVAGLVRANDKLSFCPLLFLYNFIAITSNSIPNTFRGTIVCQFSVILIFE